jgi:hypothetical protein
MKAHPMVTCMMAILPVLSQLAASTATSAEPDPRAAARGHFANGVAAFKDRRFGEAADEFEAAYKLSPAFEVLYNIGQVNVALGRPIEAVDAFQKYLDQGAGKLPPKRTQEVKSEMDRQLGRIGTVTVRTIPEHSEVRIDGRMVGKTPLSQPLRLTAGRHTFEAVLFGYTTPLREIDLEGRSHLEVDLKLEPAPRPAGAQLLSPAAPTSSGAPPSLSPRPVASLAAPIAEVSTAPGLDAEATPRSWRQTYGYAVGGVGLVAAAAGGILVIAGASRANGARTRLAHATTDTEWETARPDYEAGKSSNHVGWTVAGVGAAALAGGVFLVATAPRRRTGTDVGMTPWLGQRSAGVLWKALW